MKNTPSFRLREQTTNEAAAWLARLHSDGCTEADERSFRAWLAADPVNKIAFEDMSEIWDAAGSFPRQMRYEAANGHPIGRRALAAGLVTIPVAGAVLAYLAPASAETYQTKVGEQKQVVLSDGSRVFLDTNSRVDVAFDRNARRVDLKFGRANFRVEPDESRPFVVNAADRKIVTNQSNLDVRCDGKRVWVVLFKGDATVAAKDNSGRVETLMPGERLAAAATQTVKRDRPNLAPLLAWQSGREVFESATLSEAVTEMNRYNSMKMEVKDADIAGLRVSGVYRVGDSSAFADTIAKLLPVKVLLTQDCICLTADSARLQKGG